MFTCFNVYSNIFVCIGTTQKIMGMDEAMDDKQDMLDRVNKAVRYMSFPRYNTTYHQLYNVT